eukprot:2091702-Pleurochrysis_carterae.AAC.3
MPAHARARHTHARPNGAAPMRVHHNTLASCARPGLCRHVPTFTRIVPSTANMMQSDERSPGTNARARRRACTQTHACTQTTAQTLDA